MDMRYFPILHTVTNSAHAAFLYIQLAAIMFGALGLAHACDKWRARRATRSLNQLPKTGGHAAQSGSPELVACTINCFAVGAVVFHFIKLATEGNN